MSMYLLHKQRWNGELKGRKVDRGFLYTRDGRRTDGQEAGWGSLARIQIQHAQLPMVVLSTRPDLSVCMDSLSPCISLSLWVSTHPQ